MKGQSKGGMEREEGKGRERKEKGRGKLE